MSRQATPIKLTDEDRSTLERWIRSTKAEQRMVLRARIILEAAKGTSTLAIASQIGTRPATVSKWRNRFAQEGVAGLQDLPRPGKPKQYDAVVERRILALLDEPSPMGYATWNGRLLSETLGDVSTHQVWRVLRRHGIHLQRRRSWCISTEPEFAPKAADIVGLYLDPPEHALVFRVDEKPAIQALERTQGYLRLPNGQAVLGFGHEYRRHGTTTLFAALNIVTGQIKAGHYKRRRRREFLDFMNSLVADCPDREIHVILDNLNTHKPKHDRWLSRHPNIRFHYTPTHASWINQVEVWFSILTRHTLQGANFLSIQEVRNAIDRFIAVYNPNAAPFEWKKRKVYQGKLKTKYSNLCK